MRPCGAAAGTLEVRGAFFTLFTGSLKIMGTDGGACHVTLVRSSGCRAARQLIHLSITAVGLSLKPLKLSPEYLGQSEMLDVN